MKTRQLVIDTLLFILILDLFYEGIYKVANWIEYAKWLHHSPITKSFWVILTYFIPIGQLALSLSLLIPRYRVPSLYITMIGQLAYLSWIAFTHISSHSVFWPYHELWKNPTWVQKAMMSLAFTWIAFLINVLSDNSQYESLLKLIPNRLHLTKRLF
jgi:hypothetical protein